MNANVSGGGLGRAYRWLWVSSALSNLADGAFKVALPLIATQLTRSPTAVAGVTVALSLPWLLFALPAGALSDRLDRRWAMVVADLLRSAALGALAVIVIGGISPLWTLYLVALGVGTAETIYDTSAQSILPQLVARDRLDRANGRLYAAELTANEFLGPPLGGALVAVGAAFALATPGALWLAAAGVLLLITGSFRVERVRTSTLRADIGEGLRFLWREPLLRTLAAMVGVFSFAFSATTAVFVLFAVGPGSSMGLSGPAYGVLLTSAAVGGLIGALIADRAVRRVGRARVLLLTVVAGVVMVGMPALTVNVVAIGVANVVGGATIVIWNVVTVSFRQRITPDRLLGRVNSAYRLLAWGTAPLGAAIGGLVAGLLGLRAVFAIMAAITALVAVGLIVVTDARMDAAERGANG